MTLLATVSALAALVARLWPHGALSPLGYQVPMVPTTLPVFASKTSSHIQWGT